MPSLSLYVDEHDLHLIVDRLNANPEIAFIVPDIPHGRENRKQDQPPPSSWRTSVRVHRVPGGDPELELEQPPLQQWKAVRAVDALNDGEHSLWHVPAGLLPLIEMDAGPQPLIGPEGLRHAPIPDPWAGWRTTAAVAG